MGGGLKAQITDALVPPVLWLCCVCCFSPLLGCVSLLCFFGGQDFMKTSLSSERTFFKVCCAVGRTLSSKGMPAKKIGRRLFGARELTLVFLLLRAVDTTCRAAVVPPSLYPSFLFRPFPPSSVGLGGPQPRRPRHVCARLFPRRRLPVPPHRRGRRVDDGPPLCALRPPPIPPPPPRAAVGRGRPGNVGVAARPRARRCGVCHHDVDTHRVCHSQRSTVWLQHV